MATLSDRERELLIEEALSAHRQQDPRGGPRPSPAFFDLDDEGRLSVFEQSLAQRKMEAALDPAGESTTVRAVLRLLAR